MKKKIVTLLLAFVMAFSFVGCGRETKVIKAVKKTMMESNGDIGQALNPISQTMENDEWSYEKSNGQETVTLKCDVVQYGVTVPMTVKFYIDGSYIKQMEAECLGMTEKSGDLTDCSDSKLDL